MVSLAADPGPPGAPGAAELSACSALIFFSTEIKMYHHCTFVVRVAFKGKYQQLILDLTETMASFEAYISHYCAHNFNALVIKYCQNGTS